MKLVYNVSDKPKFSQTLIFGFQQMIAIMAATLLVPMIVTDLTLILQQHSLALVSVLSSTFFLPRRKALYF